jgi:glutamate-1-semialdehyde 2,1-aminomutase
MEAKISNALYERAKTYFPGGVNSPVRAFRSVNGSPVFMDKGDGCKIWDVDGNEYIDFCCSWGPLILGHNHAGVREKITATLNKGTSFGTPTQLENELAELILSNNRFVEKIRFVNSGTEATMSAIRLARGYTGRNKIIKFEGCYHGHADALLVKAGSGLATLGTSSSAGVPENYVKETIVLPLNDNEAVEKAIAEFKDDIACIILEPIPANNGLLLQDRAFLTFLREVCTREGILLFFDEVISGFRVGFEGAAGYYDIAPDIVAYGKIIGGGLPVGAYGASEKIMSNVAPDGDVYQAGTLSGNPVAMAAGIAQLTECVQPNFYENLEEKTKYFIGGIQSHVAQNDYPVHVFSIGSIFWLAFTKSEAIMAASEIKPESMELFKVMHQVLLEDGIYIGPSGYEVGFVSAAHGKEELDIAAKAFCKALDTVFSS